MSFLSIFRSQMPDIIKQLESVRSDLYATQGNIERLLSAEKKLSEDKTTRYENLAQIALSNRGTAIWIKDINGRFLYVNKVACSTIFKCTVAEALNKQNGELKKDILAAVCMESDKEILKSQTVKRFIEFARYPDNSWVYLDTIKSPVFENDQLIGVCGTAVEITGNIPEYIKKWNNVKGFVEVPLNIPVSKDTILNLLERRKKPR